MQDTGLRVAVDAAPATILAATAEIERGLEDAAGKEQLDSLLERDAGHSPPRPGAG